MVCISKVSDMIEIRTKRIPLVGGPPFLLAQFDDNNTDVLVPHCWSEDGVGSQDYPPGRLVLQRTCCAVYEVLILKHSIVFVFHGPCIKCYLF